MNLKLRTCVIAIICCLSELSFAADHGNLGPTYSISEIHFLEYIQSQLNDMKENGKLDALNQKMQDRVREYAKRPHTKHILPRATEQRQYEFDPSVTLEKSIYHPITGQLLQAAGTKVNPLQYKSLSKMLVFIDADDKEQIEFVKSLGEINTRIILVKGNVRDAEDQLDAQVFFDQKATLIEKFQIRQLPATIVQSGDYLLVTEHGI